MPIYKSAKILEPPAKRRADSQIITVGTAFTPEGKFKFISPLPLPTGCQIIYQSVYTELLTVDPEIIILPMNRRRAAHVREVMHPSQFGADGSFHAGYKLYGPPASPGQLTGETI
jgi:hypothetical protein